jgi:hypothetical protein
LIVVYLLSICIQAIPIVKRSEMKKGVWSMAILMLLLLLLPLNDGSKERMASSASAHEEEMKFLVYVLHNSPHLFMGVCKALFSKERCIGCSLRTFSLKACLLE